MASQQLPENQCHFIICQIQRDRMMTEILIFVVVVVEAVRLLITHMEITSINVA